MKRLRSLTTRLLGIFAALMVLAHPAYAADATSGTIKGLVIDDGGLSIPGVLLTLSSPQMIGGQMQRTSDEEGNFRFDSLAPGVYEVLAQKQGFGQVKKQGIVAQLNRNTDVTIEMKVGQEELVIKETQKTVDTEKASQGATFNKEYLSRIPSGRSYQEVAAGTAGVIGGGGNPSSGGASTNENTFMLDGVNMTDPVTGTFSLNFNFDAIDEIEVITGGYDPEYGESLGAVISVVTKSGGNTLEVVTNGFYSSGEWGPKIDARYAADGYQLAPTGFDEISKTFQFGTLVSGPIVKDKIWFLGTYNYARSLYSNAGIALPRDYDGHYFFGKITAQPSSAHRFTLQFTTDPTAVDNINQGDTRVDPEAQGRQAQGGFLTALKWNWFINPETNLETQASLQKTWINVNSVPCTHDKTLGYNPCDPGVDENTVDYTTPGHAGLYGAYDTDNWGSYYFDDRWRVQLSSKYSLLQVKFLGKHDLKIGVEGNYLSWDQVAGNNGDLYFVDLYENAFDPNTFKGYYWLEYSGAYQYNSSGYHVAGFIQDVYKPIENLTFRYGVRYDRAVQRNDAGDPIIDIGIFGPRVYAVWDPWANQKSKIYGGYGRFNETGRLSTASYLSQSGSGTKLVFGEYFGNDTSDASSVYLDYDTANTITVLDNTTAPHSDQFTLGAQREIITNISAGVNFEGKFTRNIYSFDETNLIYDENGDAYIGSGDGSLDYQYRLRSPTISMRDYYKTDFVIQRNFTDRWLLYATYSYVVSRGRSQDSENTRLAVPDQVALQYGNLTYDLRHQVKIQAAWDLPNDPWTTKLGGNFQYYSGYPMTRFYYSSSASVANGEDSYGLLKEERGTYGRTGPTWDISLLVQQEIPVKKGKLAATAQVDNITNNHYAGYYDGYYVSAENRYIIPYRQDGISAQLGAKYEF